MGTVLAVVSGKGGTGKTALCAALGSCLAAKGQSVLMVDCDVGMGNLDIALAMSGFATVNFLQPMDNVKTWDFIPKHPHVPNLFLLTAPVTVSAEQVDFDKFAAMLDVARARFDWILLDAPAGIGSGFRLTVTPADQVVLVATADPSSMRDGARTVEQVDLLGGKPMKLLVNRVSSHFFGAIKFTVDDAMDTVGLPLLGWVPEDKNVQLASAKEQPLVLYTNKKAALACLHIAQRLAGAKVPVGRRFYGNL
ncbi:MAG: AAA family ATPase [Eubacteriales bacterium]